MTLHQTRWLGCFTLLLACLTIDIHPILAIELSSRIKWTSTASVLPSNDILEPTVGSFLTDHRADIRFQLSQSIGELRVEFDPVLTILAGDVVKTLSLTGVPLEKLPGSDTYHFFDWSDELVATDKHRMVAKVDRLSAQIRYPSWSIGFGRQAVSWGNGIAFQPLDLFSPFSPISIDREFKPGVDSVLFESLLGNHAEVQLLYIDRNTEGERGDQHTLAMKWTVHGMGLSIEAILADHRGESFYGLSGSTPIGGSLVRVDASRVCGAKECVSSGLINIDHTVALGPALVYLFGELYHNGFGVDDGNTIPTLDLQDRLARGEVFTLMKNYMAVGANVTWHPLWSQSFVVLRNLEDSSSLVQTSINYDPNDSNRIQFGISVPFGHENSEFGRHEAKEDMTSGGHSNWFVSLSYYF